MSHVDEGALHAYLDGALDEFPAAEATEIRRHLDSCAECMARLEVERAIRADAHAVLGLATPDVDMPTLEDLRAYVKRTRPETRKPGLRMARMGWAASIVFAMGAGWLLRDGQLQSELLRPEIGASPVGAFEAPARPASSADAAVVTQQAIDEIREAEVVRENAVADRGVVGDAVVTAEASPAPPPPSAGAAEAFGDVPARQERSDLGNAAADETVVSNEADLLSSIPSAPVAVAAGRRSGGEADRVSGDLRGALPSLAPLGAASAGASARAVTAGAEPSADDEAREKADSRRAESLVPVTSAIDQGRLSRTRAAVDEDRRIDEEPALAVPGYDVVSVTNLGEGTTAIGAHVIQRFDGRTNFEIYHLEPGVDPAVVPSIPEGDVEVRVESEAGWVVVRGPLDEETLSVLLTLLFTH